MEMRPGSAREGGEGRGDEGEGGGHQRGGQPLPRQEAAVREGEHQPERPRGGRRGRPRRQSVEGDVGCDRHHDASARSRRSRGRPLRPAVVRTCWADTISPATALTVMPNGWDAEAPGWTDYVDPREDASADQSDPASLLYSNDCSRPSARSHEGRAARQLRDRSSPGRHGPHRRRDHRLAARQGCAGRQDRRPGGRPESPRARRRPREHRHRRPATKASRCCDTRPPTCWPRRPPACAPAPRSPSGRPSRTASTTTSSSPSRSARTTWPRSRPRCAPRSPRPSRSSARRSTATRALELFADEPYKVELIRDLPEDATITIYRHGDFVDLCRGPHVPDTGRIPAIKVLSTAGAYWRGSSDNAMLTRIYGTAFASKKDLEEYLARLEMARQRDHRKLGRELELFSFHDEAPGFPFFHAKGMRVINALAGLLAERASGRGLRGDQDPDHPRPGPVGAVGPLGQLQGQHVLHASSTRWTSPSSR